MRKIEKFTISNVDNLVAEKLDWQLLDVKRGSVKGTEQRLFIQLLDNKDNVVYSKETILPAETFLVWLEKLDDSIIDNFISSFLNISLL